MSSHPFASFDLLRLAILVLGVLALAWGPRSASAQLAVGRRALESADFQRAIRAFDRAERTERLDRDGLVVLSEGRVLARFALGSPTRAARDLQVLAALDPGHTFPVEAPPEVAEAFAAAVREAGGGLATELAWTPATGGTTLRVEVRNDSLSLVRTVRVHTRVGEGEWRTQEERTVTVEHPEGSVVAAYVELLGARDVVLLRTGTADEPVVHGAPAAPTVAIAVPPATREREPVAAEVPVAATHASASDEVALAVGLGVGAAALLAVGVVLAVVFGSQSSSQTQPATPIVVGF